MSHEKIDKHVADIDRALADNDAWLNGASVVMFTAEPDLAELTPTDPTLSVVARGGNFNRSPAEIAAQLRRESDMPVHDPADLALKRSRMLGGISVAKPLTSGPASTSSVFSDGPTNWAE